MPTLWTTSVTPEKSPACANGRWMDKNTIDKMLADLAKRNTEDKESMSGRRGGVLRRYFSEVVSANTSQ